MAQRYAQSWRNMRVGAHAITVMDNRHVTHYYHGANIKPEANGITNVHAEIPILGKVAEAGAGILSVMAVAGDVQRDDTSGLLTPTLVPCAAVCTPALEASPHIDQSRSLIISATPSLDVVQYYDVPTLSEAHSTNNPDLLTTVRFESSCSPDGVGRDEWNEKLFVPLQERIATLLHDAHQGS